MKSFAFALTAGLLSGCLNPATVSADDEVVVEGVAIAVAEAGEESSDGEDSEKSESSEEEEQIVVAGPAGAKSYSIEVHSSSTSDEDSDDDSADGDEPKVKTTAKVIVVGPDGERKVYELDGAKAQAFKFELGEGDHADVVQRLTNVLTLEGGEDAHVEALATTEAVEEERYMIGVQCDAVPDTLRSHLKLGEHGLIVMEVREETPAQEAGLQTNDIIVAIDEKELASRDDLVTSVVESEGKVLTLTIIREGDKHTISVTPKKMKVPVVVTPAMIDVEGVDLSGHLDALHGLDAEALDKLPKEIREQLAAGKGSIRMRRLHPGVIIDEKMPQDEAGTKKLIERIRMEAGSKAAAAMKEAHEAATHAHAAHADAAAHTEKLHETLIQMQKQMEMMRAQMNEMQQQLEKSKTDEK